jgi:hypothetical protein
VALLASEAGVFTLQNVTGLSVVESLLRRFPMNKLKVLTVVVRVAADAILAAQMRVPNGLVKSLVGCEPRGNLRVAFQAFQAFAPCCQSMAGDALRRAIQGLMSTGKRPRRNLAAKGSRNRKADQDPGYDNDVRPPHQQYNSWNGELADL